ncbi:MAG TPA: flagellar basal-body rod protein FlgG [Phycisphaerae bacterium]|nr:flagellar basal-body rod protein FlgG [Phycisphaerae bacterium]HNU46730.1 flagellar basal-body rod protein FlgG [Phycisphaerae bacterium]
MAITALHAAASGMRALDEKLNAVANNLANVNTAGFKRTRVNFEDLLYQVKREPGVPNLQEEPVPHGILIGTGVKVSGTQLNFSPGAVDTTGKPLDLMIEGEGFFQVQTIHNGEVVTAYTRNGAFVKNSEGNLVLGNSRGEVLEPSVTLPDDATDITVGSDGEVQVRQGNGPLTAVGQVQLARFVNPEGLKQIGRNLYLETPASGAPVTGAPQSDGMGAITQGALEMSNVDPVRELIDLITTQRAFELNSQSIQSADETLRTVSNLRRF